MSSATKLHRDYATEKCCNDVSLCKYLPVRFTHFSNKPKMQRSCIDKAHILHGSLIDNIYSNITHMILNYQLKRV